MHVAQAIAKCDKRIGGSRGRVAGVATPPPLWSENFTKKRSFWPFWGLQPPPPFPDRLMDKSSHERLQSPPLSKISRSAYETDGQRVPMWFFASLSQVFVPAPVYSLFKPEFQHHKAVNQVPIQSLNILHIFKFTVRNK